jgi:hypothetical protein
MRRISAQLKVSQVERADHVGTRSEFPPYNCVAYRRKQSEDFHGRKLSVFLIGCVILLPVRLCRAGRLRVRPRAP